VIPDETILSRSNAAAGFKHAVRAYAARQPVAEILVKHHVPRVKVLRLLHQLLHAHPEFAIERVFIDAHSGCSDFAGTIIVEGAGDARVFEFLWDCRWRAEQEGWLDCFGFPDQIRAAEEFGWQCFATWREQRNTPSRGLTIAGAQST
jgi:hypothetical protein